MEVTKIENAICVEGIKFNFNVCELLKSHLKNKNESISELFLKIRDEFANCSNGNYPESDKVWVKYLFLDSLQMLEKFCVNEMPLVDDTINWLKYLISCESSANSISELINNYNK